MHQAQNEPAWVAPLRAASQGAGAAGVECLRTEAAALPGGATVRAVLSLMLAALVVGAALLRGRIAEGHGFDLLGSLLRAGAVAFAVRALLHVGLAVRAAVRRASRGGRVLCLGEQGLYERTAGGERWLAREDALAVVVREPAGRSLGQDERPVFLVARPDQSVRYLELDARYAGSPEVLGARLARWIFADDSAEPAPPPRADAPEERYVRAAHGKPDAGDVVVAEGRGYRLRAPFAALLGVAFALDALAHAGPLRARVVPVVILACVLALALVAGWLLWMSRRGATRLGIAMLLTPEELMVRGRGGVVSVPWGQLASAEVVTRLGWSPFYGSFPARSLVLSGADGTRLTFDAGFLGAPPEVIAALAEAHRTGRV